MLLEIEGLSGGYGSGDVVKDVSCSADAGEILCLVGPNGCGKTTLFRLLLGMLQQSAGSIRIDGRDTSALSQRELAQLVAYIPQYHTPVFSYTVLDVVMMGRAAHFSAFSAPRAADREAAFAALEKLHIAQLANKSYMSLSGGQRQMAIIARAICQSARLLVMDEPAATLDFANHQRLMDVAVELAARGYCVVMSTHAPEDPASIGSRVLLMRGGRVAAFGAPGEVITPENLERVYGIEMDVVTVRDRYGKERTICLPLSAAGTREG